MRSFYIIFLICFFVGCATTPYKSEYQQTGSELQDILNHDNNLTDAQKIVLKHSITGLKNAQSESKHNAKLQEQIISKSEKAGAGNLVYWLIGVACLGIAAFVASKIAKIL